MMSEVLYICLLIVLVVLAWFFGRASIARKIYKVDKKPNNELTKHYFEGVNFLLNEQPDQAIDVFIQSVEVTPHTLETHLALGNLMRQKGEVDRAIRVHQNLLSRSNLSPQQMRQAHLELARDFLKAGLFDRAERLFLELVDDTSGEYRQQSLRHLVQIYRDEQEWEKAIRAAGVMEKKLFGRAREELAIEQAHFCCELAEKARSKGDYLEVRRHLKAALKFNKNSARANMLRGDQEVLSCNYQRALKCYRMIPQQQPDYLPEVLNAVGQCYEHLDDQDGLIKQFRHWLNEYPGSSILKALAKVIREKEGEDEAAVFLAEYLKISPSIKGVHALLDIHLKNVDGAVKDKLLLLNNVLNSTLQNQPGYCCSQCGFKGMQLHWLCPQCQTWETVKPIRGMVGE
jgi:lipopolysaccharide biosynthesis regulator YciM